MRPARLLKGLVFVLPLLAFALLGLWMLRGLFPSSQVSYTEFERLLASGQVERVVVRGDRATVTLRARADLSSEGEGAPREVGSFSLRLPSSQTTPDNVLIRQLEAQNVDFRFEALSQWPAILLNFLPVLSMLILPALLLLAALLFFLFWRRAAPLR